MSKAAWQEKQAIIDEIKEKLEKAPSAVVIDYMGITVAQADAMRKKLREAEVDYTVYKNTLVRRAIEGTAYESLGDTLEGPSGLLSAMMMLLHRPECWTELEKNTRRWNLRQVSLKVITSTKRVSSSSHRFRQEMRSSRSLWEASSPRSQTLPVWFHRSRSRTTRKPLGEPCGKYRKPHEVCSYRRYAV